MEECIQIQLPTSTTNSFQLQASAGGGKAFRFLIV